MNSNEAVVGLVLFWFLIVAIAMLCTAGMVFSAQAGSFSISAIAISGVMLVCVPSWRRFDSSESMYLRATPEADQP